MKALYAAGVAAIAFAHPVHAQSSNGTGPSQRADPSQAKSGGLGEIIVNARRSAESLQSVPVAVTALSSAFIERQNIADATSVPQFAPNLTVAQTPNSQSGAAIYIRGIGNNEPSSVSEPGVGVYLDGVYLGRSSGALFDLVSLKQIEVLRGPQGTLFGRNTIGGALVLTSKEPDDDFHVDAKSGFGRYDDWYVRGRVDTGYIGGTTIKASITAQHRQSDGYVNNILTPSTKDFGSMNANSVSAAVKGDFGKLTARYNFDFDRRSGTPAYFQIIAATPDVISYYGKSPSLGGAPFQFGDKRLQNVEGTGFVDGDGNRRFNSYSRIMGHSLTLTYAASDALTLKSITAYRTFMQNTIADLSGNGDLKGMLVGDPTPESVSPYKGNLDPQKEHQFSQELQALGTSGDLKYLAGLYYFRERSSEANRQALTFVLPGGTEGANLTPLQAFGGTARSEAVFGQASWTPGALDRKLELTLGGRYTKDWKTIYLAGDVDPVQHGRASYDNFSVLASLSYKLTRDVMAYFRYSTGYRSGGFNPRAVTLNAFQPETARVYEAGLKTEFFDRHLRLNLAAYITDYDDLQIQQYAAGSGGATSIIVNAGKVRLKGFEAEAAFEPVASLTFDGSVGYTDTTYKTFLFRDPATNAILDVASQAKPIYTPTWTAHGGAEFHRPIGAMTGRLRVDFSYRSTIYFNALDITTPFNEAIKSHTDYNLKARLSLEDIPVGTTRIDVGIWGDNLTNQSNIAYGVDFGSLGFAGAVFKEPRTYGADARLRF